METAAANNPIHPIQVHEHDDVTLLNFDVPDRSVNVLSGDVMRELDQQLTQLKTSKTKALVIGSAKPNSFIAGANIEEIEAVTDDERALALISRGQAIFQKIAELPFPTVAAINGICLGGGLELALACRYRVATDHHKTLIGLPEIRLGIIPGFGGTQRLPHVVGLTTAFDMILTGKRINAQQALRMGLVDDICSDELLVETAIKMAKTQLKPRTPKKSWLQKFEKFGFVQRLIVKQVRKKAASAAEHYPATELAIQSIVRAMHSPIKQGLEFEAKLCAKLITSEISKNLIHVFYLSEGVKKLPKSLPSTHGSHMDRIGIVGAGVMGGGIAHLFASRGRTVRLSDILADPLILALQTASRAVSRSVKRRRLSKAEAQALLDRIHPTLGQSGFGHLDMVIEAVVEKLEVKQSVVAGIEEQAERETIIATNTSSLSVDAIGAQLTHPERLLGMHFFNPVHRMPLVEIIAGQHTNPQYLARVYQLALECGKIPILVKDGPGFLVNRLLGFYMREAMYLLEEGNSIESVDQAVVHFGMPMGPFELMDVVGIDIAEKVSTNLSADLGEDRLAPSSVLSMMVNQGMLGSKNGKGFYTYKEGKKQGINANASGLLQTGGKHEEPLSTHLRRQLWERPIFIMLNEAGLCLQEGIVDSVEAIDTGMIMGTGFPPFRGGLIRYAQNQPIESIADRFRILTESCGHRFKMQPGLERALS